MRVDGHYLSPSIEDIIKLHDLTIAMHGGLPGVRDMGMLESAVGQIGQTFGGMELYPTVEEKAARLAFGIARNHPFLDGNKRTAIAAMASLLRMNGVDFAPSHEELLSKTLDLSQGSLSPEGLSDWISENSIPDSPIAINERAVLEPVEYLESDYPGKPTRGG